MKKFLKVVIVLVLLAAVTLPLAFLAEPLPKAAPTDWKPTLKAGRENTRPDIEGKWNYTIPSDDDTAGHIALAYEMYTKASQNDQKLPNRAQEVKSVTTTMGIPVDGYRYCVKRDDEFLFLEYSIVTDSTGSLFLNFAKESTKFAKRQYVNSSMSKMEQEVTLVPTLTVENGYYTFGADWSSAVSSQVDVPLYHAKQPLYGEMTDQRINPETMKTAKVSYNAEKGFYTLYITLDCENPATTDRTLPNVRKGANSDDAVYTSIEETIEIWDNGYYKHFISIDKWNGHMSILELNSTIDFRTTFYYDEASVNFDNYQYAREFINKFKK